MTFYESQRVKEPIREYIVNLGKSNAVINELQEIVIEHFENEVAFTNSKEKLQEFICLLLPDDERFKHQILGAPLSTITGDNSVSMEICERLLKTMRNVLNSYMLTL